MARMLKTFYIALVFVAAGGMMAARAQTDSTTAAGPNIEQNAPQTIPCPGAIVHHKPTAASRKAAALDLLEAP